MIKAVGPGLLSVLMAPLRSGREAHVRPPARTSAVRPPVGRSAGTAHSGTEVIPGVRGTTTVIFPGILAPNVEAPTGASGRGSCCVGRARNPTRRGHPRGHLAPQGEPASRLAEFRSEGVLMPGKRGRSAITGRFVKQSTVKSKPKTTVNESTKKGKGK